MQNQKGNTSVIVSFIIVACIIGLVVFALMRKTENAAEENANEPKTALDTTNINTEVKANPATPAKPMEPTKRILNNFKTVAHVANLEKIDLVAGTGEEVKAGATVSVHYTGAIASTGQVFQSSKDFGTKPVTFPLGGVIKGWTDGIPGMKVGGTRRLLIPSAQAYGANPPSGSGIPANADLVFDVELVDVANAK